ncbi:carboxypeptidase, M20(D) family [Staphylococcus aureus]|nr:carboxypeptidase, M20(D) family [Staphylococcus aureus]
MAKTLKEANLDFGVEMCEPQPPSEDFAYYAKERPSAFIYTGAVGTVVLDYLKGDN